MSDTQDRKFTSQAAGHNLSGEKGIPMEEYEHPTTHQMRIVGQRRNEAEAKLERQQREARSKLHE
ncbi:hypothetical protein [Arthrobacter bambusae]|uniref:hypothetical protein n=1 Tax=Arthrobacter bambusae TaxID=1338426 RepID=UPI002783C1BF|nr:hypothetical protein [Arthrobacter bambusae]MDQ0028421.1 hypothetical protein [Arthrobacter bambusae]MDQ0096784.1 hypothetical protein [Arthrobacter bambusae]